MGAKPYIRVGGNTQDYALYDASQSLSLVGKVDPNRSPDYPTTIHIGPAYFESYDTWPDVKFHTASISVWAETTRKAGKR